MTHYNVSRSFSSASQIKSYRIPRIRFKFRFPITFGDRCRQCAPHTHTFCFEEAPEAADNSGCRVSGQLDPRGPLWLLAKNVLASRFHRHPRAIGSNIRLEVSIPHGAGRSDSGLFWLFALCRGLVLSGIVSCR